jgi:xanthine dehydrogenase YagR molybdenum-binding subunit
MKKHRLTLGFAGRHKQVDIETPDDEPRPWDAKSELAVVGRSQTRLDGETRVTGRATYTFDVSLPGLLHAAVLRSPHPAATVTKLDVEPARKAPGVHAVMAVARVGQRLRFAGEDVAAVAAETPTAAREALERIVFAADPARHVVDVRAAAKPGAAQVHDGKIEERRTEGDEPDAGGGGRVSGNVRPTPSMKKGDVKKGLRAAAHQHSATYVTQVHTHSALETHGVVVRWDDDDHITCWASTQGIGGVRSDLADMFDLPTANVRVITEYMGGGFGAKFGADAPGSAIGRIAGTLAREAKRPVKLMMTRAEEHLCTGNRPDSVQEVTLGADDEGNLLAIHVKAIGTAGIATGAGVGRNAFAIYTRCPNISVESSDVFTNAGPGAAFRAPGHPQGAFAIESALDELARELALDPVELRLRHDMHPVRRYQLELGRDRFGWLEKRAASAEQRAKNTRVRRGVGVASSIWGDFGHPGASVTVSIARDGTIEVRNGVQDIGGGITSVLAMVAAEVFRVEPEDVQIKIGDSDYGPGVGSGGSQTTSSVAPACRNAAEKVHAQLLDLAVKRLGADTKRVKLDAKGGFTYGAKRVSLRDVVSTMPGDAIVASSGRPETYGWGPMKFMGSKRYQIAGVQFAEVSVDTWTGEVRCHRVLAVHDCGRVMNETGVRSQINGGVILGTGYALMEERVMDPVLGVMLNPNLEQYKPLGPVDTPEIDVLLTEVATGANSVGAAGIGEPATIPTAAAIANAVGDALGVHVRQLPITPARVLARLEGGRS